MHEIINKHLPSVTGLPTKEYRHMHRHEVGVGEHHNACIPTPLVTVAMHLPNFDWKPNDGKNKEICAS